MLILYNKQIRFNLKVVTKKYQTNKISTFHDKIPEYTRTLRWREALKAISGISTNYVENKIYNIHLFTDESTSGTNRHVSFQNFQLALLQPNYLPERKSQHYQTVKVYCGFLFELIVGASMVKL